MSNVNIIPQRVLLTSGHAVTFEATDSAGQPVPVNWSLNPTVGSLVTVVAGDAGGRTPSITYVAPQVVANTEAVAIIANTDHDSASTMISLTPDAITIVPQRVDLKADQEQQFIAIVAAAPIATEAPDITWILSPPLGSLEETGLFKAPPEIRESTTVSVIAASHTLGRQAVATVNLASPLWQGGGVHLLGVFLLCVFSLVYLMIGLWPPALPSPDTARANRIEAEKTLENLTAALQNAETAKAKALEEAPAAEEKIGRKKLTSRKRNGENKSMAAKYKTAAAEYALQRASAARAFAVEDLKKKQDTEETVNKPDVKTILVGNINRELDLLLLVLLAGFLGSFLHAAQSYSEYVGNRELKRSWAWWYSLPPVHRGRFGGGLLCGHTWGIPWRSLPVPTPRRPN